MSGFVHQELHTSDTKAAKKFYRSVFGWKFRDQKMPDGNVYSLIEDRDGVGFGGMGAAPPGVPVHWLGYVGVDSVDATIEEVVRAGGKIAFPRTEIEGTGIMAWLIDPQGASFAIWEQQTGPAAKKKKKKKSQKKAKRKSTKKRAAKKTAPEQVAKGARRKSTKKKRKKS